MLCEPLPVAGSAMLSCLTHLHMQMWSNIRVDVVEDEHAGETLSEAR